MALVLTACYGGQPTLAPPAPTTAATPEPAITATIQPAAPRPTASPAPATPPPTTPGTLPVYTYRVVGTYPHDPAAFTQGLVFDGESLYESTGLLGRSSVRQVDLDTGNVLRRRELPASAWGEGLAIYRDRIIQLTWQSNLGFVYDRNTFELLWTFNYPWEGWGLTHDGQRLILSDGTATLHFLDPMTFIETGRVEVTDASGPVNRLNELEYINGEVYANVWQTDYIVRIAPDTGKVTGRIDLTGLLDRATLRGPVDVLNGIAYDPRQDRLFVTGKLWPYLFEIKLVERQ
ncbi:MAG: glutaminyl-peptide cyclotransferase [Chloroflexi bacterium]|nr:glutaminyl-peptide cyclotransferase [Chloroflexota bacterium]